MKNRLYFDELMIELDEMLNLEDDWNGYDSKAPNKKAISNAQTVLQAGLLENFLPTKIFPSYEDGVGITYVLNDKIIYIECYNDGEIVFSTSDKENSDMEIWGVNRGIGSIRKNLLIAKKNND